MSETLLNYLNKEIKLSKIIKSLDTDFKNGYLFAELLSNVGYLSINDLSFFKKEAKTSSEIKFNFTLLKDHLQKLGVHLDEYTINLITNNVKGSAANLIYKIKTQIDRRNIRFDEIMTKIVGYQNEEKKERENDKLFNKTSYRTKSNFHKNKLPELTYMSTFYGTKTNFNSIKPVPNLNFGENDKFTDIIFNDKKPIKKTLEPLSPKKLEFMPLLSKNTNDEKKGYISSKINIDSKNKISEVEENPNIENDSRLYHQQQKKFKSHGKNDQKMKLFSEQYLENNNNYMKYSCFDRNTLKIGIDLREVDPKMHKQGIGYNNDYIPNEIVLERLKRKVNQKEEEFKKKIEEKKFMTEEERYLKNSIISQNQKNESGKKFQIHFNKDTQLYKMHEYEKYRKEAFPFKEKINKQLLYINNEDESVFSGGKNGGMDRANFTTMDRFYTKTIMSNFSKEYNNYKNNNKYRDEFNEEEFFEELDKELLSERKNNEIKRKIIREKNYQEINKLTNIIIDLTEEFYYYQNKQNVELVDMEEYKNLIQNFIEGKINLTLSNRNRNSLVNLEEQNLSKKKDNENEELEKIKEEKYISEYNDYIFYRGSWEEKKFIPKNFYGSQLQVYQVLGDDINQLTSSGKMVTQGIKPSILMMMKNDEFELKEVEKDNINLPKENAKNRLFGEIIELNFDNLPNNFPMNNINANLGISNLKNSDSKSKLLNTKIVLNQDMTVNNNTIEDTAYSANKDLIINSPNFKLDTNININNNIINNDINSSVPVEANKSNNIDDTLLNNNITNNNINDTNINNTNINNTNVNNTNNPNNTKQNNENDFSYIPIKMCLIGHSFSGRKTQAKLLCDKYPKLKYYSLEKIIDDYFSEYERLHTPIENNLKIKNPKKNQLDQLKNQRIEELKQYEYIFNILEPFTKDDKRSDELTDEAKMNILIYQIKKDFPMKEEEVYANITRRNARKQAIEQELERIKEECEKKKKYGAREIREQQLLEKELEDLIKDGYLGFIIVDFPNTYEQYVKFENSLTGFVQQIDKEENLRDKYLELLTFSLDKTYANISNLCPEVMNYLGFGSNNLHKSFFNNYIWLEIDEEETLRRVNDRLIDENTNIIYHKEFNPPPAGDKKLLERLKPVTEPSEEDIKNELKKYDTEFPKILSYISLFHNLQKISKINKNEVFEDIDELLTNALKKFEDREIKDEIVALNTFDPDESENIKYFKKLHEMKKKVNKDISGDIITLWSECLNEYSNGVKQFLYNFSNLKNNILEKMDIMQTIFIQYLNNKSQKKRLVELFQRKYEVFIDKYQNLKRKKIVKDEFQKDVVELTEHFWEIIQMKKRDAISELKNLKEQNFIQNQSEIFWKQISKLFLVETTFYVKKLNIIRKYYYEFEGNKYSEDCPYEYSFNENDLLKEINDYIIFNKSYVEKSNNKNNSKSKEKKMSKNKKDSNNKDYLNEFISPRIDRIFKNCFKFLFYYDKKLDELYQKEKEKYALNTSNISQIGKRKHRIKKSLIDSKADLSIYSEFKNIISYEDEMKAALNNEKIKYKIRISLLKFFGEQFLLEANNISDKTFENLDNSIIKSVDVQNTAMNELMEKIKKDILESHNKIVYNIELDVFDIYQKLYIPFKEFVLSFLNTLEEKDKKINVTELNKIYLDLKNYEIQDNYVTLDSVIDVLFKKHLFELQSSGFVRYLKEIPYHFLNNFIQKFVYKTPAGQNLVRIDKLFTILAILNLFPPKSGVKKQAIENVTNKLKFHCFLSKEDFMNTNLWYEKKESKNENNIFKNNLGFNSNINNQKVSNKNAINDNNVDENNNINSNNNDNDIIIEKDINNNEINNETQKQVNFLMRNLTMKSPARGKSRKPSKRITHHNTVRRIISEDCRLKEFLFNINKNYDNQINFIEFMNTVTLHFIKNKNQKKKSIKHLDKNIILNLAKSGQLPPPVKTSDKKKAHFDRKSTQLNVTKGGKYEDIYHRTSFKNLNKYLIKDKANEIENKVKQTYIGGDSDFKIMKEGENILINEKRYSIESFKQNIYVDFTYFDELIEDNQ